MVKASPASSPARRPRRVCIAPNDVASYYSGLRDGLATHGVASWFFCFDYTPYTRYRPAPSAPWLERLVYRIASSPWLAKTAAGRFAAKSLLLILRPVCCLVATLCCDVFIFGFGRTFIRRLELPLLRLLGRRIIFVFNGSDTRPAWMSGIYLLGPGLPNAEALLQETRRQQSCIRKIERYADEIVCHPLSAQLLTKPFVNHLAIGHPFAPGTTAPVSASRSSTDRLRVLHAPTRPLQKGSPQFRAAIESLRATGIPVDYQEITGRPNHEVLAAIAASDLVLDELFSDIPLAGLGTETAALGRPFLVGGYAREELERFGGEHRIPISHYVHPDNLIAALQDLARHPERRTRLAAELQDFALQQWNPPAMAGNFLNLITANTPSAWRIDPTILRYWQGWGAPEDAVRCGIAALIAHAGPEALGLNHNPALKETVIGQGAQASAAPTA